MIDVHCHPLLPEVLRTLGGMNRPGEAANMHGVTLPPWSVEQHLAVMDEHGISAGVASVTNVHVLLIGREGQAQARAINDEKHKIRTTNATKLFTRFEASAS
jgi:hypothetical protein